MIPRARTPLSVPGSPGRPSGRALIPRALALSRSDRPLLQCWIRSVRVVRLTATPEHGHQSTGTRARAPAARACPTPESSSCLCLPTVSGSSYLRFYVSWLCQLFWGGIGRGSNGSSGCLFAVARGLAHEPTCNQDGEHDRDETACAVQSTIVSYHRITLGLHEPSCQTLYVWAARIGPSRSSDRDRPVSRYSCTGSWMVESFRHSTYDRDSRELETRESSRYDNRSVAVPRLYRICVTI